MKKYNYYVVNVNYMRENFVNLFSFNEAVSARWIDQNGDRVWIVPQNEEKSISNVYGFNDLDKAIEFYDTLVNALIGGKAYEN